jgi:hypothetical protein
MGEETVPTWLHLLVAREVPELAAAQALPACV